MVLNYEKESIIDMFNVNMFCDTFKNTFDLLKFQSSLFILNVNSTIQNLYFYFFANTILEMNLVFEKSKRNEHNMKCADEMRMVKIYSFWYDYVPYPLDYPSFFEVMKCYSLMNHVQHKTDVLFEIKHSNSNSIHTTLVSPEWLKRQETYGQLVCSLNDVVKNKSNSRIHDIICVSIPDKCELTEFYKNFKHSLNIIKMTSAQFCMYLILKKPELRNIVTTNDTVTFTDNAFEETTFKNIQYIN